MGIILPVDSSTLSEYSDKLDAYATNKITVNNQIWLDRVTFKSRYGTELMASFGDDTPASFLSHAHSRLTAWGYEQATARLDANMTSAIRTSNHNNVFAVGNFSHTASKKMSDMLKVILDGFVYAIDSPHEERVLTLTAWCDLCSGTDSPLPQMMGMFGSESGYVRDNTEPHPYKTNLYMDDNRLQYVSEDVHHADRLKGLPQNIVFFTALTRDVFRNPVVMIEDNVTLDFLTGLLTISGDVTFDLSLRDISGDWLLEKLNSGNIRMMRTDFEWKSILMVRPEDLLDGRTAGKLISDGEVNGWKRYWLGLTPDTAGDENQPLICFLIGEADEVRIYRTTGREYRDGAAQIGMSVLLVREPASGADCSMYFFTTPENAAGMFRVVNGARDARDPLQIQLSGIEMQDADLPAYTILDHTYVMNDGTEGSVSMLNGLYEATFDGDVFESDFVRIEKYR